MSVVDPDGARHRWSVSAKLLAGDGGDLRRELFRPGFDLEQGRASREALLTLIARWQPAARAHDGSARLGR